VKTGIHIFVLIPDFRRDDVWMPDQVRHDEQAEFTNSL